MSNFDLVLKLFLQLVVILIACQLVAAAGRRLGQTKVVSEMVAGVLLGPTLLGLLAPQAQAWLFPTQMTVNAGELSTVIPHPSMSILYALSQLGLAIYMFLVGLEFNNELILKRMRSAGAVSAAGIVVPLSLGALAAWLLFSRADIFAPGISLGEAMLYLGASMAITSFPMLARILYERGISQTRMGTLTLAAGSLDDVVAWCLLAAVLASVKGSPLILALALGGGLLYVLGMIAIVRPWLRPFGGSVAAEGRLSSSTFIKILVLLMVCCWFTDVIGLYAVFGAFILGAVMPRGPLIAALRGQLELITVHLLLPVFFVYSGLNTRVGLINTAELLLIAAALILIAIVGKWAGCALAARAAGEGWRESITIGVLMNARGLMELIILNIGLQQGIITPTLFTMMVMMAVVTTLMASPLFEAIYGRHMRRTATVGSAAAGAALS